MSALLFPNALPFAQDRMLELLRMSAEVITTFPLAEGRKGGVVCICDPEGNVLRRQLFGAPLSSNVNKYHFFAEEKCRRLAQFFPEHLLSFQSADAGRGQFQGGIRLQTSNCLIAISGFPPAFDEAYVAAVAAQARWEDEKYFLDALKISNNSLLFAQILRELKHIS